jgi:hypothetical protein
MALFRVEANRARSLVTDPGLEVVPSLGGKVLVVVAFYQYRQTAIGVYNEVGVAIHVGPKGTKRPTRPLTELIGPLDKMISGFHIVDLPVTTDAACAAGREVWGYPKFTTPIGFDLDGRRFLGTVTNPADGGEMVRLEGRAGLGIPGPLLDLTLYSRHEGQLLRTLVNTRGGARLACGGSMRLTVNTGTAHPMAVRLDTLGLQGAQPWCVAYSNRLQLRLNAGAPVPNGQPSMEPSSRVSQQICQ